MRARAPAPAPAPARSLLSRAAAFSPRPPVPRPPGAGFNSDGVEVVRARLAAWRATPPPSGAPRGALGVNVGKNKATADAADDYVAAIAALGEHADYLVVNLSSPNTPGLRALQRRDAMRALVDAAVAARDALPPPPAGDWRARPPLLVKIDADMSEAARRDVAAVALAARVDGLVVSNTTTARPPTLESPAALTAEAGGLSGAPLRDRATRAIADMYAHTRGALPLIGVGGVASGRDAFEKIAAGASLVQMYTMLAYEGPGAVLRAKRELAVVLRQKGFASVEDAVGSAVPRDRWGK